MFPRIGVQRELLDSELNHLNGGGRKARPEQCEYREIWAIDCGYLREDFLWH